MSRTALAAVDQTPTGANAHRLIVLIRYTAKSTVCKRQAGSLSHFWIVAGRTLVCPGRDSESLII